MGQSRNKPPLSWASQSFPRWDGFPTSTPWPRVGSASQGILPVKALMWAGSRKRGVGGPLKFPENITPRKAARAGAQRGTARPTFISCQ